VLALSDRRIERAQRVVVAPEGFESDAALEGWIDRCAKFVQTLPAK